MITVIASLAITAFVIVMLAFLTRAENSSQSRFMIGEPHEGQTTNIALARYGYSERLDQPTRTQDIKPPAVGESRLPEAGVPK